MQRCKVTGYVMHSANEAFIPCSNSISNLTPERLQALQQHMTRYFDNPSPKSRWIPYMQQANGNIAYNMACKCLERL